MNHSSQLSLTLFLSLLTIATSRIDAYAQNPNDLVTPLVEYKIYVQDNAAELVLQTKAFTDAVKAGDVDKAKALFAPTRSSYEKIEPVAELFSDLDIAMDSRADDFEKKEQDPNFTGFHRIEYALWEKNSTEGLATIAEQLNANVIELHKRLETMTFPPDKVVGGAAVLMEEVAATKISGEEDRYSHTDLWDFAANVDGSQKILTLFRPLLQDKDKEYLNTIDKNFATVDAILEKYKSENGYVTYDKLTEQDRKTLSVAINTLAEELSLLRGKLGLG